MNLISSFLLAAIRSMAPLVEFSSLDVPGLLTPVLLSVHRPGPIGSPAGTRGWLGQFGL